MERVLEEENNRYRENVLEYVSFKFFPIYRTKKENMKVERPEVFIVIFKQKLHYHSVTSLQQINHYF